MSRKSTNAHQKYTHIFNFVISMLYSGHADAALVSSLDSGYIYLWSCFYLWTTFCISLQSNCTMALGAGLCTTFFGIRICFRKAMLTLLETSFTVLWMPLAQGTVVRFVDCTFHKPTIVTVVYTLVSILPCTCEPFALWKELLVARSCANIAIYFWTVLLSRL